VKRIVQIGFQVIVVMTVELLSLNSTAFAQSQFITNGLSYLQSTQTSEGYWGEATEVGYNAVIDTTIVTDTLKTLGETGTSYSLAIQWINNTATSNNDYLAAKINTLTNGGWDATSLLNNLVSSQNTDGGWGADAGIESDIKRTALALQALKSANYPDQTVINNALNYLIANQNTDGGFGFYTGDDSNVYMTSLVSWTLQQFPQTTSIATAVNKATSYLIAHQNANGGFGPSASSGQGGSTVYETALALISLIQSGQGQALPLQNAINYLTTTQLANGSWNDDPYSTALALRALANVKPNLAISSSDISFSNAMLTVGDTITITATIKNTGPANAENILVQFYDGTPSTGGVVIGETTITSIPAYGSSLASISWTIPTASSKAVYIRLDSLNFIDELNESDNIAFKNLTSATLPDLSITASDIMFSPIAPATGESVTITASVRNIGETAANNVTVDFYDGVPSSGGMLIGTVTVSSIDIGGTAAVQSLAIFTSGSHDIYITIDKANTITESDETNNTVMKALQVGGGVELSITGSDISFSPAYPVEGNLVTINASIHNEGEAEAKTVLVRFYLGDPDSGGSQVGSDITIPSILARASASISTQWDSTGHTGNKDIYVEVDPLNTIPEVNKSNNKTFRTIKVAAKTGPDLTLTSADINFTPIAPNVGEVITITATIRNSGTADAINAPLEFSLGDPEIGGTLIIGSQTIPSLAKGNSATIQMTWNTNGYTGDYEIYVNADPFNELAELSETNNTAHVPITITAPQGPDITITSIDTTNLITDTQNLTVSGSIKVNLENQLGQHLCDFFPPP